MMTVATSKPSSAQHTGIGAPVAGRFADMSFDGRAVEVRGLAP